MQLDSIIAQNYAHALFQVIKKDGYPLDQAMDESIALEKFLQNNPKFCVFLEGPQFREEDKERVVTNVFQGQLYKTFYMILVLLIRRNRPEYLRPVLACFKETVEKEFGIVSGTVTTAIDLSDEGQQMMQDALEKSCNTKFNMEFKVDPDIIGGVRVKYGDTLLDNSIATDLAALRQKLMDTRILKPA